MTRLSPRSLISIALMLAVLAGSPLAQDTGAGESAQEHAAQEASVNETGREDVLLRKMILMGFPAAAVAGLIIALIVTRKKRPRHPDDAE